MNKPTILIWNITFVLDSDLANGGDKVLVQSIIDRFLVSQVSSQYQLAILVHNEEYINKNFPGVKALKTYGILGKLKIFSYIRSCDYFVYGGGEGFQNVSSSIFLFLNLSLGFIALLFRKKVICLGSGVGQGFELVGLGRVLTTVLLSRAELIILRDKASADSLISMGVDPTRIHYGADLALQINKAIVNRKIKSNPGLKLKNNSICICPRMLHFYTNKNLFEQAISILPIETRMKLGLIPHRFFNRKKALVRDLAFIADQCINHFGLEVVFLPMYAGRISPHDEIVCQEIYSKMTNKDHVVFADVNMPAYGIIGLLKQCKVVLAMPLHSLILASLYGTPSIAINYQTKGQRFMESIGQSKYSFYLRDILHPIPKAKIIKLIGQIICDRPRIASNLRKCVARERAKADNNFELIERYLVKANDAK